MINELLKNSLRLTSSTYRNTRNSVVVSYDTNEMKTIQHDIKDMIIADGFIYLFIY